MNRKLLLKEMSEVFSNALKIVDKKNQDYATDSDPFLNFRGSEQVGVSVSRGILVRMMDKITRIGNLLEKEAVVKDESIEDTLLDLCNYCALLLVYLKNNKMTWGSPFGDLSVSDKEAEISPFTFKSNDE